MILSLITSVLNWITTYIVLTALFILYGTVHSALGKKYVIPLAITYFLSFNLVGSQLWRSSNYCFGAFYLFLAIITVPITLIITIKDGRNRIWGEVLTILTGIWIVVKEEIYFLAFFPAFFFWVLLIDLFDKLQSDGLTRKVYNRISQVCAILFLVGGYYLHQSDLLNVDNRLIFCWLYLIALSHFALLLI